MMHHDRGAPVRRWIALGVLVLAGCGEAMGPVSSESSFTADVRGAVNERLSGTASASDGASRQFATQFTAPNGTTLSVIALLSSSGTTISFTREGTALPLGTSTLGSIRVASAPAVGRFSAAYVVRKSNGLQVSLADSGTITITGAGSRVTGTFVLHASEYQVLPFPTPGIVGQPITPLETGSAPITITGTFDAARR